MTRIKNGLHRIWHGKWEKTYILIFQKQNLYWLRLHFDKKMWLALSLLCLFVGFKPTTPKRLLEANWEELSQDSSFADAFLEQKQLLIAHFLIEEKVPHLSELSDEALLGLNQAISEAFLEHIFAKLPAPEHVKAYFVDTTELNKLETALMEQAKFGIPASIKLAQSALETAYGQKVMHNNYFGIKSSSGKAFVTTEYLSKEELKQFEGRILEQKLVSKSGVPVYKCKVRDKFAVYPSAWSSFRAHSKFLSEKTRYAPLFVKGKDYRAWAERIPQVGYATSPQYSQLLKHIIKRYHLYLLDH